MGQFILLGLQCVRVQYFFNMLSVVKSSSYSSGEVPITPVSEKLRSVEKQYSNQHVYYTNIVSQQIGCTTWIIMGPCVRCVGIL